MNQDQRLQERSGGSVWRARERAEVTPNPESPKPMAETAFREWAYDGLRPAPNPARPKQQAPVALGNSRGGQGVGIAVSRPTPVSQWPLVTPLQDNPGQRNLTPAPRRPAPQRPPRPRNVPSILDASNLQEHTPSFQYRQPNSLQETWQFQESDRGSSEDAASPNVTSPVSRSSTTSSVGSISDLPLHMPGPLSPAPARRSFSLGPPPSARRGASSYYSSVANVSPIPEESPRSKLSHSSYASSTAIPTMWKGDSTIGSYYDDEDIYDGLFGEDGVPEEGRESRESNLDDREERGLVRQASLGRRGKPSVITTRSLGHERSPHGSKFYGDAVEAAAIRTAIGTAASLPGQGIITKDIITNADSPLASGTGWIDRSPSDTTPTLRKNSTPGEEQPAIPTFNPRVPAPRSDQILKVRLADNSPQPAIPTFNPRVPAPRSDQILKVRLADNSPQPESVPELDSNLGRLAIRRPPRLDINAIRDAESRGSLTSLPDLIRRATRLAAMMDKGKRPGSRLALNDFASGSDLALEKEIGGGRRHSTLSGMLAAFPPPGATPTRDLTRDDISRPLSVWPSPHGPSMNSLAPQENSPGRKKRRQCCGLPVWVFVLIILITLLIIAAAVIVPLELLVFKKGTTAAAATYPLSQCQTNVTCANGGTNILSGTTCTCICANGFTGTTCTVPDVTGCTTMNISATATGTAYQNVTLGLAIPRLVAQAQNIFSIPLSPDIILARFNAANLSCGAENALVTFDGYSTRISSAQSSVSTFPSTNQKMKDRRGYSIGISSLTATVATASLQSIIVEATEVPPTSASAGASTTPTSYASSTTSANTPTSTATFAVTQEVLDFARVAVLFVLQQSSLDIAVNAQGNMQYFFTRSSSGMQTDAVAANVSVGNGVTVNFVKLSVDLGQAKGVVGGFGG